MVLIDRRFSRELPIQPDFVGQSVDTMYSQKVKVQWDEQQLDHKVLLID
jgi:pyrimidine operon attenuation protein/uracil phosphoribosyltransferase